MRLARYRAPQVNRPSADQSRSHPRCGVCARETAHNSLASTVAGLPRLVVLEFDVLAAPRLEHGERRADDILPELHHGDLIHAVGAMIANRQIVLALFAKE